jgi:predicted amidohydrolase YtcJ
MNEGGEVFFADQRIPVEAALRAVTIDAAWQCRIDHIVGSLEPGKYADLALLESTPRLSIRRKLRRSRSAKLGSPESAGTLRDGVQ